MLQASDEIRPAEGELTTFDQHGPFANSNPSSLCSLLTALLLQRSLLVVTSLTTLLIGCPFTNTSTISIHTGGFGV